MLVKQMLSPGLFRGPRPATTFDFIELRQNKVRQIVSLESGFFEASHDELYLEDQMASSYDIELLHHPLSAILPPSRQKIQEVLEILETATEEDGIYFHCKDGVDRTGLIAAAYRIQVQGWDPERAIDEWYALGFHHYRYFFWIPRIRNWYQT
jgi:protein tyrosine/serine phosphatase